MTIQKYFSKFLSKNKSPLSEEEQNLCTQLNKLLGYKVQNAELFVEAFSLKCPNNKSKLNYERLEFLGDSVLGAIISGHLFVTYPKANEGFLTQMKSKIVNRKNLNKLGDELQLKELILTQSNNLSENITGNLFEALIGAIYIDVGYKECKNLVLGKMLTKDKINSLEKKIVSYKSLLLEWSQKKKIAISYETIKEELPNNIPSFKTMVWMNDEKIANASDASKKKAEEKAAQRAFYFLNKKENIVENTKTHS